ncbi:hypothetical protein [Streptomyces sp. NPDC086182]|uniref:scabin-related ADP-ribosyltransferase n=1 Tax=Streptomyces sp. NPDC086182 TaxID=3155058 RepID=UPI00342964A8
MTTPWERDDHSDTEGYTSEASDSSFEGAEDPGLIDATLQSVPGRSVTPTPQMTAGFGSSKYGPHPRNIVVANTGPAADATLQYRKDMGQLWRWDSRGPDVIFREGFRPHNNLAPSSLQHYQNTHQETALVSFTRDPDPDSSRPEWAVDENGRSYRYLAFPSGGYDFVSSLQTASLPGQDEVALWKGVRPEYIARVEVFDRNDEIVGTWDNNMASPEVKAALAQFDQEEAQHAADEESFDQYSEQGIAYYHNEVAAHAMGTLPYQGPGYQQHEGHQVPHHQGYPGNAAAVQHVPVAVAQYAPVQYSNWSPPQPQSARGNSSYAHSPQTGNSAGQGRARRGR